MNSDASRISKHHEAICSFFFYSIDATPGKNFSLNSTFAIVKENFFLSSIVKVVFVISDSKAKPSAFNLINYKISFN